MTELAFIGSGNMTACLVAGLSSHDPWCAVVLSDHNPKKLAQLSEKYGVATADTSQSAVVQASVVVLAVKPQSMKAACLELREQLQISKPLVITVAAGVAIEEVSRWLGGGLSIIRAMPNIPAQVQQGMTGLFAGSQVTESEQAIATRLFSSVGEVLWVQQEHDLHAVTAVSGSGPAYFFLFMEAMYKAAVSMGLDSAAASQLVAQTALGAATMVKAGRESPEQLRQRVTSPHGTTEQAIRSFEQDGLRTTVQQAMIACAKRSEAIAQELASEE